MVASVVRMLVWITNIGHSRHPVHGGWLSFLEHAEIEKVIAVDVTWGTLYTQKQPRILNHHFSMTVFVMPS